jgi:hypothetical protein
MTPLAVFENDTLAAQVIARPNQTPPPPIESWPFLLQPKAVHLRLSRSTCGSSCKGCEVISVRAGNREPEPEFPVEAWERVRDAWLAPEGEDGLIGLEVSGLGEPTVAKIFPQVARETLALGKQIYFPTHGRYLSQKFVTDAIGSGEGCRVSISMDAHDDASYVACGRGKAGEWDKMIESVKAFKIACPNATLHSQFTGFNYTIESLPGWMQVCADLGIPDTIFRLGMAVGEISREDTSLRFLREKTETAIYEAQLIAEKNGINFEVERRPYSDVQPNGLDPALTPDKDSPVNKLRRYLDLSPLSVVVCGGKTTTISDSKTCTTVFGSSHVGTLPFTSFNAPYSSIAITTANEDTIICPPSAPCTRTTVTGHVTYFYPDSTGALTPTYTNPPYTQTTDSCPGFGGMQIGSAETVRSVIVPRGTSMEAMPAPDFQPISLVDASPVVWADGSISSCFAKHMIGDIYQDTMPTLIRNPEYQVFLQRRIEGAAGGVQAQESCMNCPRNF